jgi:hypothetical protein
LLHIATVHFGSPRWIEIQTRYLREHLPVPFQTWASLEGIDESYGSHFDHVVEQGGRHSDKLNHLAIEIANEAAAEDLLMFLDGDAFPIADPMPLIDEGLSRAPLVAVRRAENAGDRQPHPCFCATTVGAWFELPGDWSKGFVWANDNGDRVSDVGANLLRRLELTGTPWVEVLRSNRIDLDPVFYAIYGGVIYHHGAGFRPRQFSRAGLAGRPKPRKPPPVPLLRQVVVRRNRRRQRAWQQRFQQEQARRSEQIAERIARGGTDWVAELTGEGKGPGEGSGDRGQAPGAPG